MRVHLFAGGTGDGGGEDEVPLLAVLEEVFYGLKVHLQGTRARVSGALCAFAFTTSGM